MCVKLGLWETSSGFMMAIPLQGRKGFSAELLHQSVI